jgi:DNA invertase Pin-like site-specific DNA recombinase
MQIGYMQMSKTDGSQSTDLQRDVLRAAGVATRRLYEDRASGRLDARPGLDAAVKSLRHRGTVFVWKLGRLGGDLRHLINVVHDLSKRSIGFKVLTGHPASIDTATPAGKLVFGICAALAEFERDLMSERTQAGLASARARGRKGLCSELSITRRTLNRHVALDGTLWKNGLNVIEAGPIRHRHGKKR